MSTEVQPPSPPPNRTPTRSSPFTNNQKQKQQEACETSTSARRKQGRSSSFSGFVSRILPSHREEKGHTLRSQYRDNGDQDAANLVFCLSPSSVLGDDGDGHDEDGAMARKTKSWSPGWKKAAHLSPRSDVWAGLGQDREGRGVDLEKGKKAGTLRRLFNSRKKGEEDGKVDEILRSPDTETMDRTQLGKTLHRDTQVAHVESRNPKLGTDNAVVLAVDDSEKTTAQQMFDKKRAQREKRRSLRESGDFLGVQGANPRTGYWDASSATSSSDPSYLSEETKKKLEEEARVVEKQKRQYEEAHLNYQAELTRVQALKDKKRAEKSEKKRLELKLRQRRQWKWKVSENGWSSVAEPELSPIEQSLGGTPLVETDHVFPIPSAADGTSVALASNVEGHAQAPLSSLVGNTDRPPTESAPIIAPRNAFIHRKLVGSPIRHQKVDSSDTIIHSGSVINSGQNHEAGSHGLQPKVSSANKNTADLQVAAHERVRHHIETPALPQHDCHFLGKTPPSTDPVGRHDSPATAITYLPLPTSQVLTSHPQLGQSLKDSSKGNYITYHNKLPPVNLKDPVSARVLSSLQIFNHPQSAWPPPTITMTEPDNAAFTTTIPTTTTGCVPHHRLHGQFDCTNDRISGSQLRGTSLQRKASGIPVRKHCHQNNRPNYTRRSQRHPIDAGILPESQLSRTKQRSTRLCQILSPGRDRADIKSTRISTSTCREGPERLKVVAQNAARLAFQQSNGQRALRRTRGRKGASMLTPEAKRKEVERGRVVNQEFTIFPVGGGDIGNPSRARDEILRDPALYQRRLIAAASARGFKDGGEDSLVVWSPGPRTESTRAGTSRSMLHTPQRFSMIRVTAPPSPAAGSAVRILCGLSWRVIQTAWWFIEPIFDPVSGIRRRWDHHRLTCQDASLFIAAALFAAGGFLVTVVLGRAIGMGVQIVRLMVGIVRVLAGS